MILFLKRPAKRFISLIRTTNYVICAKCAKRGSVFYGRIKVLSGRGEAKLAEKDTELAGKDAKLAENATALAEKDAEIAALQEQLKALQK